jgi:hypothetical protein
MMFPVSIAMQRLEATFLNEIGQAFGIAEMPQLSHGAALQRRYWTTTSRRQWRPRPSATTSRSADESLR